MTVGEESGLFWVPSAGGTIPPGAIEGGITVYGEALYIGRFRHQQSMVIGKVHPSHGVAYVSFGEKEHRSTRYEVQCFRTNSEKQKFGVRAITCSRPRQASTAKKIETNSPISWEQVDCEYGITSLHHVHGGHDVDGEPLFVS